MGYHGYWFTMKATQPDIGILEPVIMRWQATGNIFLDQKQNYRGIGGANLEYDLPWIKGLSVRAGFDFDALLG